MTEFQTAAEQIARAFKTPTSADWVVSTGRRDMTNSLLDAMRSACSQSEFDEAAYQFKRQVLVPYYREVVHQLPEWQHEAFIQRNPLITMRPKKRLGTWDEMRKDPAFSETQYRTRGTPQDTTTYPQLMRIAEDPVESEMAARQLGVTPEELRSHIREQFNRRARDQFMADMRTAAAQGQMYRDSLAKQYEESLAGTALGAIAPEVTGYQLEAIRSGKEDGWKLAKAIAKDAVVDLASLGAGWGVGKFIASPYVQAAVSGAADAAIEAGRQAASDYYKMDPANIAAVGGVSATLPGIVGGVAGYAGRIPGLRRLVNPIQRKIRGMLPDAAQEEAARAKSMHARAVEAVEAAESGDPLAREGATDALEQVRSFMEESPARAYSGTPLTRDDIRDIVMDPELAREYFVPPSAGEFTENIVRRSAGPEQVVDVGGRTKLASDAAEEWLDRAKKQWPETYRKVSTPEPKPTILDKIGEGLVDFGSREETLRRRAQGEKSTSLKPSRGLEELMASDPKMVRMWEAGFAPRGNDALNSLYNEWKEKFGR